MYFKYYLDNELTNLDPLFKSFCYVTSIKELCLSGNHIHDEGIMELSNNLKYLPNLTWFYIRSIKIIYLFRS